MFFILSRSAESHICLDRVENQIEQKYDGLLVGSQSQKIKCNFACCTFSLFRTNIKTKGSIEIGNKCAKR